MENERQNEITNYLLVMCFFKSMLLQGIIEEDDYSLVEETLANKYNLSSKSLFRLRLKNDDCDGL